MFQKNQNICKIVGNQIKTFVELDSSDNNQRARCCISKRKWWQLYNCIIICYAYILIFNKMKIKFDFAEETI
jgi:hypothetical protein